MGKQPKVHKRHAAQCEWCARPDRRELDKFYINKTIDERGLCDTYELSRNTVYSHISEYSLRETRQMNNELDVLNAIIDHPVDVKAIKPGDQIRAAEVKNKLLHNDDPKGLKAPNQTLNIFANMGVEDLKRLVYQTPVVKEDVECAEKEKAA